MRVVPRGTIEPMTPARDFPYWGDLPERTSRTSYDSSRGFLTTEYTEHTENGGFLTTEYTEHMENDGYSCLFRVFRVFRGSISSNHVEGS
jgi:hypothetical protein